MSLFHTAIDSLGAHLASVTVDIGESIPRSTADESTFQTALQLVFGLAGAIALLIIVIGSLRLVLSQGDPQSTVKARNTVLYAIIGLVVCIIAFSIVTFVLESI